jgi:hypothetical protein
MQANDWLLWEEASVSKQRVFSVQTSLTLVGAIFCDLDKFDVPAFQSRLRLHILDDRHGMSMRALQLTRQKIVAKAVIKHVL